MIFFIWFAELAFIKKIVVGCMLGSFAWMFSQGINFVLFNLAIRWQLPKTMIKSFIGMYLLYLSVVLSLHLASAHITLNWHLPADLLIMLMLLIELTIYPLYRLFRRWPEEAF